MAAIRLAAPRRSPSLAASLAYKAEHEAAVEHAHKTGALCVDQRDLAERLYDAGHRAGVVAGRAQEAAPVRPPDLAAVVASLRAALGGGDLELRAAVEAALEDLTRPPQRWNAETGSPTET